MKSKISKLFSMVIVIAYSLCRPVYGQEVIFVDNFETPEDVLIASLEFADSNLKACIEATAAEQGWVYVSEFRGVSCSPSNVSDLGGIEALTASEWVSLRHGNISDLRPLQYLRKLNRVFLPRHNISDITGLSELQLTIIDMGGNQMNDPSPFAKFTDLVTLRLFENGISDVSSLGVLTKLKHLALNDNQISDIASLNSLTNLDTFYLQTNHHAIPCNQLAEFSFVTTFEHDSWFDADSNGEFTTPPDEVCNPKEDLISDLVFSDKNLKSCVDATAAEQGWVYVSEFRGMHCAPSIVSDLQGIEALTASEWVSLPQGNISDLTPLQSLTNLTGVFFWRNSISDFSPLSGRQLTNIDMGGNQINDPSVFAEFSMLKSLRIYDNGITDVSSLSGLTNLTHLAINANDIPDISSLTALVNLDTFYINENGGAIPCEQLEAFKNVELFVYDDWYDVNDDDVFTDPPDVNCGPFKDLISDLVFSDASLEACVKSWAVENGWVQIDEMLSLDCTNKGISNLAGIDQLTSATSLALDFNQIENISPLQNMLQVRTLVLENNLISDIAPMSAMINLVHLNLDTNQIQDISALQSAIKLETLNLQFNDVSDLSALEFTPDLRLLWLFENEISDEDLAVLATLANMQDLDIQFNNLTDISVLSPLTKLKYFYVSGNMITDVSIVENFSDLINLWFWSNQVSDITALYGLSNLASVVIFNNQNKIPCSQYANVSVSDDYQHDSWYDADGNGVKEIPPDEECGS